MEMHTLSEVSWRVGEVKLGGPGGQQKAREAGGRLAHASVGTD